MNGLLGKHVLVNFFKGIQEGIEEREGIIIAYYVFIGKERYLVAFPEYSFNAKNYYHHFDATFWLGRVENMNKFIGCELYVYYFSELLEIWNGD